MYHRAGMVPLVAFAVMLLHPPLGGPPNERAANPAVAPLSSESAATPSVRVEHELVRLPKARPQSPSEPQRIKRPSQWRSTRLAMNTSAPPARTPLLVRASRAFVGDGRYKPEPFPRVAR